MSGDPKKAFISPHRAIGRSRTSIINREVYRLYRDVLDPAFASCLFQSGKRRILQRFRKFSKLIGYQQTLFSCQPSVTAQSTCHASCCKTVEQCHLHLQLSNLMDFKDDSTILNCDSKLRVVVSGQTYWLSIVNVCWWLRTELCVL